MEVDRKHDVNVQRYSASQDNIVDHVILTGNKCILSSTMFVSRGILTNLTMPVYGKIVSAR